MSATNRGAERITNDLYETPAWCTAAIVRRLISRYSIDTNGSIASICRRGHWLEPSAGNGAIIQQVKRRLIPRWTAIEKYPPTIPIPLGPDDRFISTDFLEYHPDQDFDFCIGNPPYSLALEFVQHALTMSRFVCFLLRLNFLAGQKRSKWMRAHMPDVFVLPKRPSFVGGKTDACEYAWMIWIASERRGGHLEILDINGPV